MTKPARTTDIWVAYWLVGEQCAGVTMLKMTRGAQLVEVARAIIARKHTLNLPSGVQAVELAQLKDQAFAERVYELPTDKMSEVLVPLFLAENQPQLKNQGVFQLVEAKTSALTVMN